jgi:hypothetical protein
MLSALEETKRNGGSVVAVNPLPEAGLIRFKNPQRPRGLVGRGTAIADQFLKIRPSGLRFATRLPSTWCASGSVAGRG